jgi:predicted  nucleic acid-binding Zn-ribbon protein
MENVLDLLVKIQGFDFEVEETRARLAQIPHEIEKLEKQIKAQEQELTDQETRIQELKKDYKLKEIEIADNEDKMNKLNAQTFAVKTNEEYRAILNEVDFLKKKNGEIEDSMLGLLEEEEKLKNSIGTIRIASKEYITKKKEKINELKKEEESALEKQTNAQNNFENSFATLPDDLKELYNRIAKVRDKAVCLISDNTCTGCYANLTHQFLNELKKRNKILLCDNCGRILVYTPPGK